MMNDRQKGLSSDVTGRLMLAWPMRTAHIDPPTANIDPPNEKGTHASPSSAPLSLSQAGETHPAQKKTLPQQRKLREE